MITEPAAYAKHSPAGLTIDARLITFDDGEALRRRVLRPGNNAWRFPFSPSSDFFHMGAFIEHHLASVVSFLIEPSPDAFSHSGPNWRLRGMATEPGMQSHGIGGILLEEGVLEVSRRNGSIVWCYGRTTAGRFYRRHGFQPFGDVFDIPDAGLHSLLVRHIEPISFSGKYSRQARST
ncbi:putative Acetyltransferase, GNAT family [Mesorhizobium metallidurans STM 2683]|uniref:Putative Acetyltransferase, GNAT family n=1 Tax=Mesorhizobium metallidurans STM 2683 TaxID=1297569 RepID=M5EEJ4_9HYPH|nr:GNAT family N-acetyltransferase [Mesorhizobium metallidurans]CCV03079.1 putative Acetyltransferase, GNAT family [Mesorhizobium metallidurans STM 2683]